MSPMRTLRSPAVARAALIERRRDTSVIPPGPYCSVVAADGTRQTCPYWAIDPARPRQMNGYCAYLDAADWDAHAGVGHLWDKVKECALNEDDEGPPEAGDAA